MFISTQCRVLGFFVISSFLVACGGGTSSGSSCSGSGCAPDPVALQAGVVKGPLTGPRSFTLTDGEGTVLASGPVSLNDTMANPDDEFLFDLDASAALSVETPTPLLLEVNASGATDATTSATPIVTEFKTLISRDMLLKRDPVVLSPLGTLATDLLLGDELPDGETFASVTDSLRDAIERAMNQTSAQVIVAFGFGVAGGANVFSTPTAYAEPADGSVIPANELQNIIGLRKANEAFALALQAGADGDAAVLDADAMLANVVTAFSLDTSTSPATRVISRTEDAAIDGIQEFLDAADAITDAAQIVPGTTIGDIEQLLFAAEETTDLGQMPSTTQTTLFNQLGTIGLSLPAIDAGFEVPGTDLAADSDGDGDLDGDDPFPNDPTADRSNALGIQDSNDDGILNIGDNPSPGIMLGDPNDPDDLDRDGVPDLIDNCTSSDESDVVATLANGDSGDVNPSQIDSDGDGYGDSCDLEPDNPVFFNREAFGSDEDADGDFVIDLGVAGFPGEMRDNCNGVPNQIDSSGFQPNNDEEEEASALGITVEELRNSGRGIGDACDSDNDNDGLSNNYKQAGSDPLNPDDIVVGDPDPEPLSATSEVFSDRFSLAITTSPTAATEDVRFRLETESESDVVVDGSADIDTSSNNVLDFSRGAATFTSEIDSTGAAGSLPSTYQHNRFWQLLDSFVSKDVDDCTVGSACSLLDATGREVSASNNLADTLDPSMTDGSEFSFTHSDGEFEIATDSPGVLGTADGDSVRDNVENLGGVFRQLGSSWIGVESKVTTRYSESSAGDCDTALDDPGCTQLSTENGRALRVFAEQPSGSLGALDEADYGLVEFEVSYSTAVGAELVTVRTNVDGAAGSSTPSEYTTVSGVNADASSIIFSNTGADPARVLAEDGDVNGQITLGGLSGFADKDGGLLTLVKAADPISPTVSDVLGRAYGLLLDTSADNNSFDSGITYDATGLLFVGDEVGVGISSWFNGGDSVQLTLQECVGDPLKIEMVISARPAIIGADYREDIDRLPEPVTASLPFDKTSECFSLTSGRFSEIEFVEEAGEVVLELEGFYGQSGLLLRGVTAFAAGAAGSDTVLNNVMLTNWDDLNGNGQFDDGEVSRHVFVDDNSNGNMDEACAGLGIAPCTVPALEAEAAKEEFRNFEDGDVFGFGRFYTSLTIGGAASSPDQGLVDLARDNDGVLINSVNGLVTTRIGAASIEAYTVGQGIVFGFPVTP